VRVSALPSSDNIVSQQISRINYGRPETWSFFFGATITGTPEHATAPNTLQVGVDFDLIIGVGRSQMTLNGFGGFTFMGNKASLANASKWQTQTTSPELNDPGPSRVTPIDTFPAQDIQLNARIFAFQGGGGPAVGDFFTIQLEAYFAPRTHIRPEWFQEPPHFPAGENKGM
jgi:hypothetical protein